MGKRFNNSETYLNQEISFTYEGQEMTWYGDYQVRQYGEESDWEYPGDCETEIEILYTDRIEVWNENLQEWVIINEENLSIIMAVELEIEKSL
jgi:hypothetical protein